MGRTPRKYDRPLRLNTCTKLGFDTELAAKVELAMVWRNRVAEGRRTEKTESRIYLCSDCGLHHVTSLKRRTH
jgi:hypothetical protein